MKLCDKNYYILMLSLLHFSNTFYPMSIEAKSSIPMSVKDKLNFLMKCDF